LFVGLRFPILTVARIITVSLATLFHLPVLVVYFGLLVRRGDIIVVHPALGDWRGFIVATGCLHSSAIDFDVFAAPQMSASLH